MGLYLFKIKYVKIYNRVSRGYNFILCVIIIYRFCLII